MNVIFEIFNLNFQNFFEEKFALFQYFFIANIPNENKLKI